MTWLLYGSIVVMAAALVMPFVSLALEAYNDAWVNKRSAVAEWLRTYWTPLGYVGLLGFFLWLVVQLQVLYG